MTDQHNPDGGINANPVGGWESAEAAAAGESRIESDEPSKGADPDLVVPTSDGEQLDEPEENRGPDDLEDLS